MAQPGQGASSGSVVPLAMFLMMFHYKRMVSWSYNHCHIHQWCVLCGVLCQIHVQWSHFWRLLVTVDFWWCFMTKVWLVDHMDIVININGWCVLWGVFRNVPNSRAVVTLLEAVGYCWFWWCFITKVWSVDHIIIVIYINGVCYRGSSEMSQIHVQWWHFLTAIGYCVFWWCCITKEWSVHHIIIVMFINWVCYKGSSETS